jgi:hypothetical protein
MKKILSIFLFLFFSHLTFAQKQVTHLVMFKLKPGITKEDPKYLSAYALMKDLPKKIKDIEDWSFGENFSTRPIAYDVGLISVFNSKKDLQNYLTHPAHIEVVNAWIEIADWNIVDFEESE